jgi:hypothetical protein
MTGLEWAVISPSVELVMNWEAIGAVGEILGAVAVLITLVYLAYQIKQYTAATLAATNSAYADAGREFSTAIATCPELARAMANWPENPLDADPADQVQILSLCRAVFHVWANTHRQHRDGTLDPGPFNALRVEIATYAIGASDDPAHIRRARMLNWAWATERFIFPTIFQEFVDELLSNPNRVLRPAGDAQ